MFENLKQTVHTAADHASEVAQEKRQEAKMNARLIELEAALKGMDKRVDAVAKKASKRKGGFPFGLLLIGGLGYALYNPDLRKKLLDRVGEMSPAAKDLIGQTANRAGDAVDEVKAGRNPADAARDAAKDMGQSVQAKTDHLQHDAQRGMDRAADRVQDVAYSAQHKTESVADRVTDAAKDIKQDTKDATKDINSDLRR